MPGHHPHPKTYDTGAAFILYDPDRGTDDYFVVENRRPTPGTYDKDAPDDGLVIWRIDEKKYNPPSGASGPEGGPIAPRSPNQVQFAWDPSDPLSPERTMTSPWRDGTTNNLAVRAIGPSGDVVRAYFDVRGPGVMVDTYPVDVDGPPKVVAGALQTIAVPVMNTGEAVDTFEFSFTGLPDGWTAVPRSVTLAPGVSTLLNLDLTPAHDHPEDVATVSVTGWDLAAVVRSGGRVVVVEGGLGTRFLPDDCGIGVPGSRRARRAGGGRPRWRERDRRLEGRARCSAAAARGRRARRRVGSLDARPAAGQR